MAFVDDQQLVALSVSPKRSLFPVFKRAEAMTPLITILAIVPPLYVLVNRTLTPLDAAWGLKAVAVSTADSTEAWLDPSTSIAADRDVPLAWQPPLSSWLVAGVMKLTSTERPFALVLASFLATAAMILFAFGLSDRLRGPQFAWWTTCLIALSGPILQSAQTPAPTALTLALALATCWGFTVHVQQSKRLLSLPLVGAGLAWGLCLLAGGPVAMVLLAVLLVFVLSLTQVSRSAKKAKVSKSKRVWKGRPALESLGILAAIGLLVGGWWGLWMLFRHGGPFLSSWLMGTTSVSPGDGVGVSYVQQLLMDASQMGGVLFGFTILGIWAGARLLGEPENETEKPVVLLLLAWMGLPGLVWLYLRSLPEYAGGLAVVWRGFFLLPQAMLAALAIEQIAVRRISFPAFLSAVLTTAGLLIVIPVEVGFGLGPAHQTMWPTLLPPLRDAIEPDTMSVMPILWRMALLGLIGWAGWSSWQALRSNDFHLRVFLGISLTALVACHGLLGYFGVRQTSLDDRALSSLRKELVELRNVSRYHIIAPKGSPAMLKFTLASLWPEVGHDELDSWHDPQLTRDLALSRTGQGMQLVVDWNDRDTRAPTLRINDPNGNAHIVEFLPVGSPQILWEHRLKIYELTSRPIPIRE